MSEILAADGESLIIYPDKKKILRRLNMRALFVLLPVVLALFAVFGFISNHLRRPVPLFLSLELEYLPWFVLVLYACIYFGMLASIRRQKRPIVEMSPEGLTIYTTATQLGLVRWDEIADVRTYKHIHAFVGIVPRDTAALCRRLGKSSLMIRMNSWCVPLYRFFGIWLAPINIPQEYLPMSGDELAQRIRTYYSTLPRVASSHTETGVWPPEPTDGSFYRAR